MIGESDFLRFKFFAPYKKELEANKHLIPIVVTGNSTNLFMESLGALNEGEKNNILNSSKDILQKCVSPGFKLEGSYSNTGLVIGKVQSGKTLSFTSLIALARDNGYKVVIVISGRTKLLLGQTAKRLSKDLEYRDDHIEIAPSEIQKSQRDEITALINKYLGHDSSLENNRLLIIPVLKHQGRLRDLRRMFEFPQIKSFLKNKSVLIIDDEADQASLNTEARRNVYSEDERESAVFSSIKRLRGIFPYHSYIQYTATPQANLLISNLCTLSPDWHTLLIPGENYVGGNEFFAEDSDSVMPIPVENDVYPLEIQHLESIPESLKDAIIEFFILAILMSNESPGGSFHNKGSMLVHPTFKVNPTDNGIVTISLFYEWINEYKDSLLSDIRNDDIERIQRIYNETRLRLEPRGLFLNFPLFEEVIRPMEDVIAWQTKVHRVVGKYLAPGEDFPWDKHRFHILVGGQLLDRGFTVENLMMTYMPRDTKTKNQSDTIQQRCRFYGYKKHYFHFCRVYVTDGLFNDYISYNKFENDLHNYLSRHTIQDLYRDDSMMLFDANITPTNMSRISDELFSEVLSGHKVFSIQSFECTSKNDKVIKELLEDSRPYFQVLKPKDPRYQKDSSIHNTCKLSIDSLIRIMQKMDFENPKDIILRNALLNYIDRNRSLTSEFENFWLIEISPELLEGRSRTVSQITSFDNNDEAIEQGHRIPQLFFGGVYLEGGGSFFGDRDLLVNTSQDSLIEFEYKREIILQVHKIHGGENTPESSKFYRQSFYVLDVYCAPEFKDRVIHKLKPYNLGNNTN